MEPCYTIPPSLEATNSDERVEHDARCKITNIRSGHARFIL
jgi:hypothetical protein